MQRKTEKLSVNASKLGMNVNIPKATALKVNAKVNSPISLGGEDIELIEKLCYLGSVISKDGGTDKDISVRIGKARYAFRALQPVWLSRQLSLNTKLRIFSTNVKSVLLYGCETWRSTRALHNKLHVFVNKCLRYILGVRWLNVISNEELQRRTNMESIVTSVKRRKWRWIGHTLRRESNNVARQAFHYHPQGKRKVGRPKNNWKRSKLQELE